MTEMAAKLALKKWRRVERKAHNDKVEHLRRKDMRSAGQMGSNAGEMSKGDAGS